ncbi:MAG: hypothetical protein ACW99F_03390 [Candidatus Hodarchaeales archaeon]|jgi:hypothetical protein
MQTEQFAKCAKRSRRFSIDMEHGIYIQWEIIIGILIPGIPLAIAGVNHYIKKNTCFVKMKSAIEQLQKHDEGSVDSHDGFDSRLSEIESRQLKNEIYLKLLLDHNNIKYD